MGSSEIIFGQYGFFGGHLDNEVQYIGVPGPIAVAFALAQQAPCP